MVTYGKIKKITALVRITLPLIYPAAILFLLAIMAGFFLNIIAFFLFYTLTLLYLIFVVISFTFDICLVKRLTPFFIEVRVPFLHKSTIFQKADKKMVRKITCREIYIKLAKEKTTLPKNLRADWEYNAITHQTLINHLQKSEIVDANGVKNYGSGFNSSLKTEQKQLIGKRCKKCLYGQTCYYKRKAQMKRRFFIIKFRTKSASLSLET